MKKIISFVISILMMTQISVVPVFAAGNGEFLINESFNSYATNSCPENLDISGRGVFVKDMGNKNKALNFSCREAIKSVTFVSEATDKFFISFDISADNKFSGDLVLGDGNANYSLLIFEKNQVKTSNGKYISGVNKKVRNFTVILDINTKKLDVIIDGKTVMHDFYIPKINVSYAKTVKFSFSSDCGANVMLDNVNCANADMISKNASYPQSAYSTEVVELVPDEMVVDESIYTKYTFNAIQNATNNNKGNTIAIVKDENADNSYLHFESTLSGQSDYHLDMTAFPYESDALVYQFDFRLNNYNSWFNFYFKDSNNATFNSISVKQGGKVSGNGGEKNASVGEWHTVAWSVDLYNSVCSVWLDGEKISRDTALNKTFLYTDMSIMRFHVQGKNGKENFDIDNFVVYGGTEPREINFDPNAITEVVLSDTKTAWESDNAVKSLLKDHIAYHKRSGYLYSDEKKIQFENLSNDIDEFVIVDILSEIPGAEYTVADDKSSVSISGHELEITSEPVSGSAYINEGKIFIPLKYVCTDILGKKVEYDDSAISGGLIVIGDTKFEMPEGDLLLKLNNFVHFERPDRHKVLADYKESSLEGVHPRILATSDDFERIKQSVQTDPLMKKWYESMLSQAEKFAKEEPLKYELRDGVRLWYVSMDFIERISHFALTYRLTGDLKWAERGYKEMKAIADFPGWHPEHRLDVGGLAVGYAIGYDWLYDALTDEQRAILEKGAYKNAMYEYNLFYQSTKSTMQSPLSGNNHNAVMNGGALILGIAFMDVYPEICSYFVASAMRCNEPMIKNYAPNGAWYEGLSYAAMTAEYEAYLLGSLKKVFGKTYGLEEYEGLSEVARYFIYMQSKTGAFGFADGGSSALQYDAAMIWFMNNYGDFSAYTAYSEMLAAGISDINSTVRQLLWYNPEMNNGYEMSFPLDKVYDDIDIVTARSGFESTDTFVGMKGGTTQTDHGHVDMGTFAYYSNGVCWTAEYGAEGYNLPGYWYFDDRRYQYFRLRAEAHNCLIINPDEASEYSLEPVYAKFTEVTSKPRGMKAVLDMTPQQAENATSALRGYLFADNRQSLVVRDEVNLKKQSEVLWFFQTYQDVTIDGKSAIITAKGDASKQIRIDFAASSDYELSAAEAAPLPTSPHPDGLQSNAGSTRIMLKMTAPQGPATITAKISPIDCESDISEYDMPINAWKVPDGEIPEKPKLDKLTIDGKEFACDKYSIKYINEIKDKMPVVVAESSKYNVEVKEDISANLVVVTLTDPTDTTNKGVYRIFNNYVEYKSTGYVGVNEYKIYDIQASSEPQKENPILSSIDRNLSTRWSAEGAQWLMLDLGQEKQVDTVLMAFMSGASRNYAISIEASANGEDFTEVFSGKSSGQTNEYEAFSFEPANARYIRINGFGSNANNWNSWTEVAVGKSN